MLIDKSKVDRVLIITLSNVGDVLLTTPVLSAMANEFPGARIDVMVGPGGKDVFDKDPRVFKVIVYDKHLPMIQKRRMQLKLKKLKYDLVVDIRNTVFPLLIGPRYRTATIQKFPNHIMHRKIRHLYRLKSVGIDRLDEPTNIHITKEDSEYVDRLITDHKIKNPIVVINPGAKSHLKRWTADGFAEVADRLMSECRASVIMIGVKEDELIVRDIISKMEMKPYNFVDKTNIRQLAQLLRRSKVLITNDSAPLHLGCAVGIRVVALFGPTDPRKYGPTGEFDIVVKEKLVCAPCENAECAQNLECMRLISPDSVFEAAKILLEGYE